MTMDDAISSAINTMTAAVSTGLTTNMPAIFVIVGGLMALGVVVGLARRYIHA